MTDFLDRLLGRAGGQAIRPLIPTLFEPLSARAAVSPLPMGTSTDTGHAESASSATDSEVPPVVARESTRTVERIETRSLVPPNPESRPVSTPSTTRSAAPHSAPVEIAVDQDPVQLPAAVLPAERPDPAPAPVMKSTSARTAAIPMPLPPAKSTSARIHTMSPPRAVAQPMVVPRAARAVGPSAPEVRISIGRVEISAATPAPAATRRPDPPKAPKLSLDNYLRGRAGSRDDHE